jgi:hypothetical protein
LPTTIITEYNVDIVTPGKARVGCGATVTTIAEEAPGVAAALAEMVAESVKRSLNPATGLADA